MSCPQLPQNLLQGVPLADYTTFRIGGASRFFAEMDDLESLRRVCLWARCLELPLLPLGEGSNLLVSDEGFPGLVVRWKKSGWEILAHSADTVLVKVQGGTRWDDWVATTVAHSWQGVECLSGIPGTVGAAPIQNIGAYGQEVADTIVAVETLDRESGEVERHTAEACEFAYRQSRFKQEWKDRYVVTAVEFRLQVDAPPRLRYGDLTRELGEGPVTLVQVREAVLRIRASKSMVWNPSDPNHRSAGSFFMNPVVPEELADQIQALRPDEKMPRYAAAPGSVKLSAAWLIERAGFPKGYRLGPAGLSSNHVLALINRGEARCEDILRLAAEIQQGVRERFGVELEREPQLIA